jgi:hypothetical protein
MISRATTARGFGLHPERMRRAFSGQVRENLDLSRLGPRAVVAVFRGGRLTTDAGALLLREVGDRLGLFDAPDAAIPDPRHPAFIVHEQRSMLAQRVIALASGYEDLNDHQALGSDPALH